VFCTPSLSLTDWFVSLYKLVIPNRCLKPSICAVSSLCSLILKYWNSKIPTLACRSCTSLFWITPWLWNPAAETCRSFIIVHECILLSS
jgi:hypothetical protein